MGRPNAFDCRSERFGVGYVTREEMDRRALPGFEYQVQAMIVFSEVINPDVLASVGELLDHPRTDAAVAASHQNASANISITYRSRSPASCSQA